MNTQKVVKTTDTHSSPTQAPALMTKKGVAGLMSCSASGIDKIRTRDQSFPRPIRHGDPRRGRIYFVREEIEAYLRSKMDQREVAA